MTKLKTVFAAALLCSVSSYAHATYSCAQPIQTIGTYTTNNPVVATAVTRNGGSWSVVHTLADGQIIERSTQYNMVDRSANGAAAWAGWSLKHPNLWMEGVLNNSVYTEIIHDQNRGGAVIGRSEAQCSRVEEGVVASTPAPTYSSERDVKTIVPADPNWRSSGGSVPIIVEGPHASVPVIAGGFALNLLIDTGASESSITAYVADRLLATNQATSAPSEQFKLADGSSRTERSIIVNTLTIGSHVVHNVRVGVVEDNSGVMLLGFDVLNRISSKFAINTANSTLDFD